MVGERLILIRALRLDCVRFRDAETGCLAGQAQPFVRAFVQFSSQRTREVELLLYSAYYSVGIVGVRILFMAKVLWIRTDCFQRLFFPPSPPPPLAFTRHPPTELLSETKKPSDSGLSRSDPTSDFRGPSSSRVVDADIPYTIHPCSTLGLLPSFIKFGLNFMNHECVRAYRSSR